MKTKQETFDIIVKGIIKQGCRSSEGRSSKYRGPYNRKCAAGLLIPDEKYSSDLEGHIVTDFPVYEIIISEGHDPFFVQKFQNVHDEYVFHTDNLSFIDYWKKKMTKIAIDNNLKSDALNE